MSAIFVAMPWRGPMVDASEAGFNQGNRQAAAFMYSGIAASEAVATHYWKLPTRTIVFDPGETVSIAFDLEM